MHRTIVTTLGALALVALGTLPLSAQDYTFIAPTQDLFYDPTTGVGSTTADFIIAESPTVSGSEGFAMAVSHSDNVTVGGSALGSVLEALNMGTGPGFFALDTAPGGGTGFTVGCANSLIPPFDTIMYSPVGDTVFTVTFETVPPLLIGNTVGDTADLTFVDGVLGPVGVPVDNLVAVALLGYFPVPVNGVLNLIPQTPYIRGDADGDGAVVPFLDGNYILAYAFASGPVPPCLSAADADGSGDFVGLFDGLYMLNYGFVVGSPPPPAPFPACGFVASPLSCDAVTCP